MPHHEDSFEMWLLYICLVLLLFALSCGLDWACASVWCDEVKFGYFRGEFGWMCA